MCTNLTRGVTSGSASTPARHDASQSQQRRTGRASRIALGLMIIISLAASPLGHRAAAGEASRAGTCRTAEDVMAKLFPTGSVSYDFTGADADKLKPVMDWATKAVSPEAALIRVVLIPRMNEAFAFAFDTDGCQTVTLALDFAHMAGVFETAGVNAPFGATYYRLPGASI
jgi:hypothetical protein